MIPYGRQNVNEDDIQAVIDTIRSGIIAQGPKVQEFEESVAEYVGAKYAVAVMNGTAALHLAYLALGLKAGDEVITTPNTFAATTNMLLVLGVKPVFCDIRTDTYNIDESQIEKYITSKTRAIVPVHFGGHPCEMDVIMQIAKKHNLFVVEDACHALGASYKEVKIGGLDTDMSIFSFHPVKSITTGEGGMIVTNNKNYYEKIKLLRSHGISKDVNGFNVMTNLGFNYRITDIQTSLGVSQLKRLDSFIQKRHEVARWYLHLLRDNSKISFSQELDGVYSSWHLFMIRVKDKNDRMPLYKHLLKNNIGVNFHYPCVYRHPYYQENGYGDIQLRNADLYHDTAITLPLHTLLAETEVKYISHCIESYFKK